MGILRELVVRVEAFDGRNASCGVLVAHSRGKLKVQLKLVYTILNRQEDLQSRDGREEGQHGVSCGTASDVCLQLIPATATSGNVSWHFLRSACFVEWEQSCQIACIGTQVLAVGVAVGDA